MYYFLADVKSIKINLSGTQSYVLYIQLHIFIMFYFGGEECIFT